MLAKYAIPSSGCDSANPTSAPASSAMTVSPCAKRSARIGVLVAT
jgi:hypothetical protein